MTGPEFTQTHVHRVSDAIQPSHPLSSPSPLAPIPPSIRVFSNESTLRLREPLVRRQGSQVSMRVARGSASWLSSHGHQRASQVALVVKNLSANAADKRDTGSIPVWGTGRDSDAGRDWGKRRRGRQRMRWLDGIADLMDVSVSELRMGGTRASRRI